MRSDRNPNAQIPWMIEILSATMDPKYGERLRGTSRTNQGASVKHAIARADVHDVRGNELTSWFWIRVRRHLTFLMPDRPASSCEVDRHPVVFR